MHIGFLGFGLIAGSITRAIRANPAVADWTMAAWSPSGDGPREAARDGVIDTAASDAETAVAGADLVVLAAPASACLTLVDELADRWHGALSADAVVTDVASTKVMLVERADAAGLRFVGGHPMAGRETTGYATARADLFDGRPWVVVPGASAEARDVARVESLALACSARVVRMDAATHDAAVGGVSHLPLLVSAALVEAVAGVGSGSRDDWATAASLAAGGWRDMTRLARGDVAMGSAIATTNAAVLAGRVRDLRAVLDAWLVELERPGGPDEAAITARLEAVRDRLEAEP
jgi:prephenate dehydrogenase